MAKSVKFVPYERGAGLGVDTLPAEIWVDEGMTMELYDFGAEVDVSAPPPDQVGDLKKLIQAGQGGS